MMPFSFRAGRSLLLMLAVFPAPLLAQDAAAVPAQVQFDVVSIRPHKPTGNDASDRRVLPGGRFTARATTVKTLMRMGLNTDDNRILGAPGWTGDEMFDIDATTADRAEVKTPEQFQGMILSLLEDRFQLKFHREKREGPVYCLEVDKPGKLGPGLKPSADDAVPNMSMNSNSGRTQMRAVKMTMADVAAGLRKQAGRNVEDHTGLTGFYDFQVEWSPEATPDSTNPSLFTVLKEQLGLKLQPAKGTVEQVVIDRVELPSEN